MSSTTYYWEHHSNKAKIREFVLPNKAIKHGAIFLPGEQCLDVNLAFGKGLLHDAPSRSVILVEKDRLKFEDMEKTSPNHKSIRCIHGNLESICLDKSVDYAYLDFLGGMAKPVAQWMASELSQKLVNNSTVSITQMVALRGNTLIPMQADLMYTEAGSILRQKYGRLGSKLLAPLMLIHRIFHEWDFRVAVNDDWQVPEYRDMSRTMRVYKLVEFQKVSCSPFNPLT